MCGCGWFRPRRVTRSCASCADRAVAGGTGTNVPVPGGSGLCCNLQLRAKLQLDAQEGDNDERPATRGQAHRRRRGRLAVVEGRPGLGGAAGGADRRHSGGGDRLALPDRVRRHALRADQHGGCRLRRLRGEGARRRDQGDRRPGRAGQGQFDGAGRQCSAGPAGDRQGRRPSGGGEPGPRRLRRGVARLGQPALRAPRAMPGRHHPCAAGRERPRARQGSCVGRASSGEEGVRWA